MRRFALLIAVFFPMTLSAAPVPKELKRDERFEGSWRVEKLIISGKESQEQLIWSIDAEGACIRHGGPVPAATTARPIQLKFDKATKDLDYIQSNMVYPGKFRLVGDTLEISLNNQGGARPPGVDPATSTYVWTLKRVKPEDLK